MGQSACCTTRRVTTVTTNSQWRFDDLQTFDAYSAEGHIGSNPLLEVMQQGDDDYRQGNFEAALFSYQQLVQAVPTNGWMHYRLAHTQQKLGDFDRAIASYWTAFRLGLPAGMGEDDSPIALCDIGAVYAEAGDIEGAIAAFRLSSRFRFSTSAAYGLGQALYLNGEPLAALAELKAAAKYDRYKQSATRLMAIITVSHKM